jgi:hypothetical protein
MEAYTMCAHLHLFLQLYLAFAEHDLALGLNQIVKQLPLGKGALLDGAHKAGRGLLKTAQLR